MILWSGVTILSYLLISKGLKRLKMTYMNPIIITLFLLIAILLMTQTPYTVYKSGTDWITFLLGPIVVMLAIPLYNNRVALKENFTAVMIGVITSLVTSTLIVVGGCKLFKLDISILLSMLPKSITTPMALEVTSMIGGKSGLTIIFVIITGIVGASLAPMTLKVFGVKDKIAMGIGIGASSHGIGTSKAVEMDEEIGAASGLAMGIAGVVTVLIFSIVAKVLLGG